MEEPKLFIFLAVISLSTALAVLFLRRPLLLLLAALFNTLAIVGLLFFLQAPILALVQFTVLLLLFAGAMQLIRAYEEPAFRVSASLSFGHILGLLVSLGLGVFVLLHFSEPLAQLAAAQPSSGAVSFLAFSPEQISILGLSALLLLSALLSFRWLKQSIPQGDEGKGK